MSDQPMIEPPREEHAWLQRLVGEWAYEADASMGPDQPRVKMTGAAQVRPLGSLWILCEASGEMPDGQSSTSIITLGFDPKRARFVGSFIASTMSHFWPYDGALDAGGRVLALDSEGPSFTDPNQMALYRDSIEIRGDDEWALVASMPVGDGQWQEFMTTHYRRIG